VTAHGRLVLGLGVLTYLVARMFGSKPLYPVAVGLVLAVVLAWLMSLVGLVDDAPPAPLDPRAVGLDVTAICALVATTFTAALAWVVARTRVIRGRIGSLPDPAEPGAACITSLALATVALPIAFLNPYAALLLAPPVHLWMLATLTGLRTRTRFVMAAIGIAPLVFVGAYYMWRLELSPPHALWYLLLLVTGNQTGLLTTLAGLVLLAVTVSVGAILIARARSGISDGRPPRRPDEPKPSIFGPGGHAGPGMLGGTESAARR
jgi:hypothetical protein